MRPVSTSKKWPWRKNKNKPGGQPQGNVPHSSALPSNNTIETQGPWVQAYEIARKREPNLMADYAKHLASLHGNTAPSTDQLTPQFVESIVKKLMEDREKKQWRVSLLGRDIKIREQTEGLVKFLLWSDTIVSNAVSTQPYAALGWAGVSILLPLLANSTTKTEAMLRGFNSVSHIQIYGELCEKAYLQSSHPEIYQGLIKPLGELYSYIIEYQARVICHLSSAQLSRAWKNVTGWDDWEGKAINVDNLSKQLSTYLGPLEAEELRRNRDNQLKEMLGSRINLDEILYTMEELKKQSQINYDDQKERNLLEALASNYLSDKNFNPSKADGTCEWFFKDDIFCEWLESKASSLLWVSAGPGCGKSVLSRALIDEKRLSTSVTTSTVCYFFFKDGIESRMDSTDALCSILHQLFTHNYTSDLIKYALPVHKSHGAKLRQNFSELWGILLKCANSQDAGEIVCIIDALDECKKDSRKLFIDELKRFYERPHRPYDSSSRLKFLITSRPYDDLEASFKKFSGTTSYLRFDGDDMSEQISQDINLVIDARVDNLANNFSFESRRKICDRLKSMQHRTYLWLYLTFDIIQQSPSEYGRLSDIETFLSRLPSKVSEAYETILGASRDQARVKALLHIVFAATRPLTLDEANVALTLALREQQLATHAELEEEMWKREPPDTFKTIVKNLCGLFINVYDSKLFFIHQTAREFLIDSNRGGDWKGCFNMSQSQTTISQVCFHYLLLKDFTAPVHSNYNNHGYPSNYNVHDYPFLSYAAANWPFHYLSQEDTAADRSRKTARMLCNPAGSQSKWRMDSSLQPRLIPQYQTELAVASYLGLNLVVDDILAQKEIDINAQSEYYGNALHAASSRGHEKVVELLLGKGADINAQIEYYGNALQAASSGGHEKVVELLLGKGADVSAQDGYYGNALQAASSGGHEKVVELLLGNGADINAQGGYYRNALQAASSGGHEKVVELLLGKGADVSAQDGYYGNALQAASSRGHEKVVELLLGNGADINAQGGYYRNALQAASSGGHEKVVELLLGKGADVNAQGGYYRNALQAASSRGHEKVVKLLLDKGANMAVAIDNG